MRYALIAAAAATLLLATIVFLQVDGFGLMAATAHAATPYAAAALIVPSTELRRVRGLVGGPRADGDPNAILAELKRTVEAFKAERDKELADIKKGLADVVQTEKVDRINAEITKLQSALDETNAMIAALRTNGGGAGNAATPERRAHAAAFDQFFRRGVEAGLRDLEVKATLRSDSDQDGGYLAPEQTEQAIDRILGTVSVMRQIASVMQISAGVYKKLVNQGGAGAGWVGERESRPETSTPALNELAFPVMELYANPAATQTLLDDARVDISTWLGGEVSIAFSEQEGAAFVSGDGQGKPRGVLSYTTVANASYAWGKLGYVASGVAAALTDASNNGTDALLSLYYALKGGYRNGAAWLMSDAVMGTVRKFKDGQGNYIWAPPTAVGELATVLGKPVYNDDNMPAVGAGAFPIAFGNFQRGYLIVDRFGIRVLRDPFTNKPYVHFYTTKRVGGGVQNFEAIKLLKVAAS